MGSVWTPEAALASPSGAAGPQAPLNLPQTGSERCLPTKLRPSTRNTHYTDVVTEPLLFPGHRAVSPQSPSPRGASTRLAPCSPLRLREPRPRQRAGQSTAGGPGRIPQHSLQVRTRTRVAHLPGPVPRPPPTCRKEGVLSGRRTKRTVRAALPETAEHFFSVSEHVTVIRSEHGSTLCSLTSRV